MLRPIEGPPPGRRILWARALGLAKALFAPVALGFIAYAAWLSRDVMVEVATRARMAQVVCAIAAWCLLHLLTPLITRIALAGMATEIEYRTALEIHIRRLPARYLPGGIWQTVGRVADLRSRGIDAPRLAILVAMENAAPFAVALVLSAVWLSVAGAPKASVPALGGAGLVLALLIPWAARRALPSVGRISAGSYLALLGTCAAFWLVAGLAFSSYWSAFPGASPEGGLPQLMGSYLLAWSAGFAAIFAPQGIGVFESVAGLMLDGQLPFALVAVLVAGFRATTLVGDLLAYAIGLLALRLIPRGRSD